jgi:ferrous iron transport protein A
MVDIIHSTTLLSLKQGHRARIAEIHGGREMVRRMMSLGLRVGSIVDVINHRGKGVVVGNSGARVALGCGVAEKLLVEPLD